MKFLFPVISAISAAALSSFLLPAAVFSQPTDCPNFWENPNTGQIECFGAKSAPSNLATPSQPSPSVSSPTPPTPTTQASGGSISSQQQQEFTKRFVSACKNYPAAGLSPQKLANFCNCAAGEAMKLPQEKLLSLANAASTGKLNPDLLQDPDLQNIATTCAPNLM